MATRTGAVPETIENGTTGFVVDATNDDKKTVRDIAEKLMWCKSHMAETRLMGARLRETILAERTLEKTCETFKKVMERAIIQMAIAREHVKAHAL